MSLVCTPTELYQRIQNFLSVLLGQHDYTEAEILKAIDKHKQLLTEVNVPNVEPIFLVLVSKTLRTNREAA